MKGQHAGNLIMSVYVRMCVCVGGEGSPVTRECVCVCAVNARETVCTCVCDKRPAVIHP